LVIKELEQISHGNTIKKKLPHLMLYN